MTSRLYVFLLILLFIFLRLPSLFEPYWYGDEAIYLTLGWLQRLGFVVYRDFYDHKPPLILLLSALLPTLLAAKIIISALLVPTLYCFYQLCRKWLSQSFSRLATVFLLIFTSIPLFEGNIYNSEIINLCLVILAFYLFFVRNNTFWPYFVLGIAFTNKFPVLFDFLFLLATGCLISKSCHFAKLIIKPLVIFLIPTLIFSIYFGLNSALPLFIKSAFLDNIFYISSWHAPGPGLQVRLLILLLTLTGIYFTSRRVLPKRNIVLWLFTWLMIDLFASLLSSRPYPHYLLQIVPPLAILIPVSLAQRPRYFSLFGFGALILVWLTYTVFQFYRYSSWPYYQAFYKSVFIKDMSHFENYFGPHVNRINILAAELKSLSSPGQRLLLWGDWPQAYHLSGMIPALPYITSFHVSALNASDTAADLLAASPPPIIAILKPSPTYAALYDLTKKFYRLEVAAPDYDIYVLR